MDSSVLLKTDLPLPLFGRGKVRDTYDLGDLLLIIATDRISAFDVVLPCGIPDKGLSPEQTVRLLVRTDQKNNAQPPGRTSGRRQPSG